MTDDQRKTTLSILWIFVILNMVYADILGMLRPGYLEMLDTMSRELSGGTVLLFAALMELVIVMVVLARVLGRNPNRIAHAVAVPIAILWVVVPALMPGLGDSTPLSYVFFATIEVITMVGILVFAWRWPPADAGRSTNDRFPRERPRLGRTA